MDAKKQMNQLTQMLGNQTSSIKMMNELLDYIEKEFKPSNEVFGHIAKSLAELLKQKGAEVSEIFMK